MLDSMAMLSYRDEVVVMVGGRTQRMPGKAGKRIVGRVSKSCVRGGTSSSLTFEMMQYAIIILTIEDREINNKR